MTTPRAYTRWGMFGNIAVTVAVLAGVITIPFLHDFSRDYYPDYLLAPVLIAVVFAVFDPLNWDELELGYRIPFRVWSGQALLKFLATFIYLGAYAAAVWLAGHWTATDWGAVQFLVCAVAEAIFLAAGWTASAEAGGFMVIGLVVWSAVGLLSGHVFTRHLDILGLALALFWGAALAFGWWRRCQLAIRSSANTQTVPAQPSNNA